MSITVTVYRSAVVNPRKSVVNDCKKLTAQATISLCVRCNQYRRNIKKWL